MDDKDTLFKGLVASDMPTYRPRRVPPPAHLSETERLYSLAAYGGLPGYRAPREEFGTIGYVSLAYRPKMRILVCADTGDGYEFEWINLVFVDGCYVDEAFLPVAEFTSVT
jgi:hypothetical protein